MFTLTYLEKDNLLPFLETLIHELQSGDLKLTIFNSYSMKAWLCAILPYKAEAELG